MSVFTLAVSYLNIANFLWFRDLTFKVPMQYCFLQHHTLLSPPDSSRTGSRFCFDSVCSFLQELFLCSLPVVYWAPPDLWSSSLSVIPFYLFILFMEFSRQECWCGLPYPSPGDQVLTILSISIWVDIHGMGHNFISLHNAVIHVIILVSFLWLWFSFCLPSDGWG